MTPPTHTISTWPPNRRAPPPPGPAPAALGPIEMGSTQVTSIIQQSESIQVSNNKHTSCYRLRDLAWPCPPSIRKQKDNFPTPSNKQITTPTIRNYIAEGC